jgi:hypothetical protein
MTATALVGAVIRRMSGGAASDLITGFYFGGTRHTREWGWGWGPNPARLLINPIADKMDAL